MRRRAGGRCEACGEKLRPNGGSTIAWSSFHHRYPRREGTLECPSNLLHVCRWCHRDIHRDEDLALALGLMVDHDQPHEVEYLHHGRWRARVLPDGTYVSVEAVAG